MAVVEDAFDKVQQKMISARIEFMGQLARFSNEELICQFAPDQWSPLQIAYHLFLIDGLALDHLRLIQAEDNPLLNNIANHATDLLQQMTPPTSLETVLVQMAARRKELFTYLSTLSVQDWGRPFHYATWGTHTLYQFAMTLSLYDRQHTQQLVTLRTCLGSL